MICNTMKNKQKPVEFIEDIIEGLFVNYDQRSKTFENYNLFVLSCLRNLGMYYDIKSYFDIYFSLEQKYYDKRIKYISKNDERRRQ